VTPAWQVYFEVADFDASVARACSLGGEQGFWRDAPNAGRIGVVLDPSGGLFLIAQPLAVATS
jgi:predicted enzyme related to lactoylglutathione lyase